MSSPSHKSKSTGTRDQSSEDQTPGHDSIQDQGQAEHDEVHVRTHPESGPDDEQPTDSGELEDTEDTGRDRRVRRLTEKAQAVYDDTVNKYKSDLDGIQKDVNYEMFIATSGEHDHERDLLRHCRHRMSVKLGTYAKVSYEFRHYLERCNTIDSNLELDAFIDNDGVFQHNVDKALRHIDYVTTVKSVPITKSVDKTSRHSGSSARSARSSTSTIILRQAAKAEAAKARFDFSLKAAELKRARSKIEEETQIANATNERKKADVQTELELLNLSIEKAAAEAEFSAMEKYLDMHNVKLETSA